jgi:hypothetical protein
VDKVRCITLNIRIYGVTAGIIAVAENSRVGKSFGQEILQPIASVGVYEGVEAMTPETVEWDDTDGR